MSSDSTLTRCNEPSRTILVTGASSGIGLALTEAFSGEGHTVYATARKDVDLERLSGLSNVLPLRVDVRDPESIAAAVVRVEEGGTGLDGLVNNAGVGGFGPLHTVGTNSLLFLSRRWRIGRIERGIPAL